MRIGYLVLICLALANGLATADTATVFGKADETWDAQISPDGAHLALGCSPNGRLAVCIFNTSDQNARPKLVEPATDQRLLGFYWASDDHLISNVSFFRKLNTSDGIVEIEGRRAMSYSLSRDRLTMLMQQARAFDSLTNLTALCDTRPDKVLMELSVAASAGPQIGSNVGVRNGGIRTTLYEVDLNSGRMDDLESAQTSVFTHLINSECEIAGRVLFNDQRGLYAIEVPQGGGFRTVFEVDGAQTLPYGVRGFTADRSKVVVFADYGEQFGYYAIDLASGDIAPFESNGIDIGTKGLLTSRFDDSIIGYHFTDDLREEVFFDPTLAELQAMLEEGLPGKTLTLRSVDRNGDRFAFQASAPGTPAEFYLVDLTTGQIQPLGNTNSDVSGTTIATRTPIRYAARDGLQIPGYLTLPPGKTLEDGPFPTILMPHGGPEARDTAAYDWWSQAYAAEGYAIVQPNFRGSSGYGPEFRNAGFGEFGGAMVNDVIDAISWAEATGVSTADGVCVVGGSYGGYSALMTALEAPDKVKCVVAVAPVTDIVAHMGRFDRHRSSHAYWERYVGLNRFSDDSAKRQITPADRVGGFKAPVLLIHGKEDLVVTPSQSRMLERAWGNRPGLRYVKMEGQDHYLTSTQARTTVLKESLAHLSAYHPSR
ncbi:MAG: alpha/beta fold hydrolase [Pseudomonadota bacterium]